MSVWKRRIGILFMFSCFWCGVSFAAVRAWEGTIDIPTYPWGPDDLNPKFRQLEGAIYYPYPLQDVLSSTKTLQTYRALFLENEYLRVVCLPELGGRIYSVLDKTTGEEMFHRNHVIKPSLIGLRGAWISGGVEWNTGPQGHTVTAVSPVDALLVENDDGSASIAIGNTEMIFRTRWTVILTLLPGRSFLDEKIRIFNPTDGVHPYYFWNCTAFPCRKGTRFIYPMTLGCDHNGENFFHWPIHEGKDLSWLKNYDRPTSIFAYDCIFDFFGAYDVDRDQGLVQFADHHILPGKKAWTWGQSEDGLVSQKALTDEDGPYIEVQSGPLRTQADFGLLGPHEEISWKEWWYPVHGLGDGFEFATRDVAIQTYRSDKGDLEVTLIGTGDFPEAEVILSAENSVLLKESINLSPSRPSSIRLPDCPNRPVRISVKTSQGDVLAQFVTPLPIPEVQPPETQRSEPENTEDMTAEELVLKGVEEDKKSQPEKAREWYEKALKKDASCTEALRRLAVLDLESGLYEEAAKRLREGLERNPDDGMAWFFLGAARLKQGLLDQALDAGYQAVRFLPTSSVGYDLVGRVRMRMGQVDLAEEAFRRAIDRNARDTRARENRLLVLLSDPDRDFDEVAEEAHQCLQIDPTSPIARLAASSWMSSPSSENEAWPWGTFDYVGEKNFMAIETSLMAAELGRVDLVPLFLFILFSQDEPHNIASIDNMLNLYYGLYLRGIYYKSSPEEQETQQELFDLVDTLSTDYVFPSRTEAVEALEYALAVRPKDANAHLLLGNLYAGLGRVEESVPHWKKATELNPDLSVALRNLGLYAWKKEKNLKQAEQYYRQAIRARPLDDTLYRDLARILIEDGSRPQAIRILERIVPEKAKRLDVVELLARTYVDEQQFTKALDLLEGAFFVNWEGRTTSHDTFVQAHLGRGKKLLEEGHPKEALEDFEAAFTYPEHLGVGRPAAPEEAELFYWKGKALATLGRSAEAQEAWKSGSQGEGGSETQRKYREKCQQALESLSTEG